MQNVVRNLLLAAFSSLLAFLAVEVGWRIIDGRLFYTDNFVRDRWSNLFQTRYPAIYDPLLGYVPGYNDNGVEKIELVTILPDHTRSNAQPQPAGPAILATGDSFTFGDEVRDHQSWPAALERTLQRPVINAGVFGYGFDQTVLRTEQLAREHPKRPALALVSLVADDIMRCGLRIRNGIEKPYFVIEGDNLVLRNNPVSPLPAETRIDDARAVLGYSYVIHRLMLRLDPVYWGYKVDYSSNEREANNDFNRVACLLARRLGAFAAREKLPVAIVLQYLSQEAETRPPLFTQFRDCVDAPIKLIDLFDAQRAAYDADPTRVDRFYLRRSHMSEEGNAFVAETLARELANWPAARAALQLP